MQQYKQPLTRYIFGDASKRAYSVPALRVG
jgi:hypothetical protein